MKSKALRQSISLILALILVVAAPASVFADAPSPWAEDELFMAETAYRLGNEDTYSDFQGSFNSAKFLPVIRDLAEAYDAAVDYAMGSKQLARGDVITALCWLITGETSASPDEATAYFVNEKLIAGRGSGDYELDKLCTVEEMLVFSTRVYEYLAYQTDRDSKGFFWEVLGGANKGYLLGSIHLSDGSMYPLSKPIEAAFARADHLAVEVDVLGMTVQEYEYYDQVGLIALESGKTIRNYVSTRTYFLYKEVMEMMGVPQAIYDFLKPWYAWMLLQGLGVTRDPTEAQLGLDMYFLRKAYAMDKKIIQLEGSGFQLDMLDAMSPDIQEFLLLQTLFGFLAPDGPNGEKAGDDAGDADNAMREVFNTLLEIVRRGDEYALSIVLSVDAEFENPLEREYNEIMLTNRNKGMAQKIDLLLNEDDEAGDYFVVVGAAHMLGRDGLVGLLTDLGYKVVRIK